MKSKSVDKFFLWIVISLIIFGLISFVSASLGVLAKNEIKFYGILFNQIILGLGAGAIVFILCQKIPYIFWKKYSFAIFLGALIITGLVFIPSISIEHGGAKRWISIFGVSFQPVELLKLGFIFYLAGWLSWAKDRITQFSMSIFPLLVMLAVVALLLLGQPDHKSLILLTVTGGAMVFISGVPWKYILISGVMALSFFGFLVHNKPYLRERVATFFDATRDPEGSSYQIKQSLIAVGSGGLTGRGLGQSIQKFSYLPEPHGDSIFAVVGEEFGFIGSSILVLLFTAFCLRGLWIASRAPDSFGRLLVVGLVILLTTQSFLNIASTLGLFPLTGVPLIFVSHGGSSLLFSFMAVGIILSVSKNRTT